MKWYIELDTAPADEDCAQCGQPGYEERARRECSAYIEQLWREIKKRKGIDRENAPESFSLTRRSSNHEYGIYYTVGIGYDPDVEESIDLAIDVENNIPLLWDEEAKKQLENER